MNLKTCRIFLQWITRIPRDSGHEHYIMPDDNGEDFEFRHKYYSESTYDNASNLADSVVNLSRTCKSFRKRVLYYLPQIAASLKNVKYDKSVETDGTDPNVYYHMYIGTGVKGRLEWQDSSLERQDGKCIALFYRNEELHTRRGWRMKLPDDNYCDKWAAKMCAVLLFKKK